MHDLYLHGGKHFAVCIAEFFPNFELVLHCGIMHLQPDRTASAVEAHLSRQFMALACLTRSPPSSFLLVQQLRPSLDLLQRQPLPN